MNAGCAQKPWLVVPQTMSSGRAQTDVSLPYLLGAAVTALQGGRLRPSECRAVGGAREYTCEIIK